MTWPMLAPAPVSTTVPLDDAPSFSVVIAVHQGAATITEAVESVLAQSHPPAEIVVCDDGSTDGLATVLAPLLPHIVLVVQPHSGVSAARNRAVGATGGDFVVILDADDVWHPDRLAALAQLARDRPDLDILTTDAHFEVDGQLRGRFYDDPMTFPVVDQHLAVFDRCFVMGHAAVRRSLWDRLGGLDPGLARAEDWDLWLRALHAGARVGLVPEPLARYRLRPESLTADRVASLRARVEVLDKALDQLVLSERERVALLRAHRRHRRRAVLAEAEHAILVGDRRARRAALSLASAAAVPWRTRVKALVAVASPRVARGRLVERPRDRLRRPLT